MRNQFYKSIDFAVGKLIAPKCERYVGLDIVRSFALDRAVKPKSRVYLLQFLLFEGLDYARNRAKNCMKLSIGRKPYFSYENIFFRLYLRQLLGIQPIRKVTCICSRGEGAGAQALMTMYAITFARTCGLTYVHTPFTAIAHADRPMEQWVDAWEAQFNFGIGELPTEGDNREILNFPFNLPDLLPLFGLDSHDLDRRFEATIPEFRRKYYSNKSPVRNEILTICVHVRRGDVTVNSNSDRYTSTNFFKKAISEVTAVLDARDISYKVRIFSQEDHRAFAELNVPGMEIFSNVDAIWSMQQIIEADIFIMSRSAFSYVAATISDGIKIGEDFYPPLSGWIIVDSNGEFDRIAFERQLVQHIDAKAQWP